ncbi:MAG: alpha/beta fold hydrolase [Gammaproteobacteria bacterium]
MADHPLILIHGAWAGRWVWDTLLPGLHEAGFDPIAVDLPADGSDDLIPREASLDRYLQHLDGVIGSLPGPFSLVAHSGAGVIATQLAERYAERVAAVVYIAGMMLPSGMEFGELVRALQTEGHSEAAGIWPYLRWDASGEVSEVPPEAAMAVFFQDADEAMARAAAARLTPQGERGRALAAHWSQARFGRIPRLYVEALQDRSVVLAAQRRMQALTPGAEVVSLDTGHAPQLAAPETLLKALLPFLRVHCAFGGEHAREQERSPSMSQT